MIHRISWKAAQAWKLYTGPISPGEMRSQLLKECFSKRALRPVASTSPGHLVEMKILRPPPRPTEETLGTRANSQSFNKFSRWFWCTVKFENHCLSMVLKKTRGHCFPFFGTGEIGNWMPETTRAAPEEPGSSASVLAKSLPLLLLT